ncbi:MAG: hypothetical protein EHM48_07410 [Planctomycetaceae bacterium]|nr:MAG: hypothetical protein EHM48_07410 [Planctomycetaceae bacterium]
MDTTSAIIQNVVATLRQANIFKEVAFAGDGNDSAVPRATLTCEGQDIATPDDRHDARWVCLKLRVTVRTRSQDGKEAVARAADLCDQAIAALTADPYRGGQCCDLPTGRATEIDRVQTAELRRPDVQMAFVVRCNFEVGTRD